MNPNTDHPEVPWLGADFFENQRKFPPEELMKHEDQQIAWSWDGSQILASASDYAELDRKLKQMGIDPSRVVHDYVPPSDMSQLGGASVFGSTD
jgi:hypothetical protein